jgi:hypothetical protein
LVEEETATLVVGLKLPPFKKTPESYLPLPILAIPSFI